MAVSGSTLAALAAALVFNRGVVGSDVVRLFAIPSLALLVAGSVCATLAAAGALDALPAPLLPLLPPAAFAMLLLVTERATLFRELAYLRAQLARPAGSGEASDAGTPLPT
jgi:hypothetical protein